MTLACALATFIQVMAQQNIQILDKVRYVLMDGTVADRLAAEKAGSGGDITEPVSSKCLLLPIPGNQLYQSLGFEI